MCESHGTGVSRRTLLTAGGVGLLGAVAALSGCAPTSTRALMLAGAVGNNDTGGGGWLPGTCTVGPDGLQPWQVSFAGGPYEGREAEQASNVATILNVIAERGLSTKAARITLMTALAESQALNLGYGDFVGPDSRGMFQQRDPWGPEADRLDPAKATAMFLDGGQGGQPGLLSYDWQSMPDHLAAQAVQRSAFSDGSNYAAKGSQADQIIACGQRIVIGDGQLALPADPSRISWWYGMRDMFTSGPDFHNGVDFRVPTGTPIRAAGAGIASTGWDVFGGGNYVTISHGDGLYSGYFHLSEQIARPGQKVQTGDVIARSGNTGSLSLGPHLHFMVGVGTSVFNSHVDPAPYLGLDPKTHPTLPH